MNYRDIGLATNPEEPTRPSPTCPVCGEECYTIYYDRDKSVVGCENCVDTKRACEEPSCYERR